VTKVKICGITNLEDARLAVDLGADFLGFNFYPKSPRYIAVEAARQVIEKLGHPVGLFGVFVNESCENIFRTSVEAGIDTVQLHGDESVSYIEDFRSRFGSNPIKAFRITEEFSVDSIDGYIVDGILLDACIPNLYGGSGVIADWATARIIASKHPYVYLAGGLNPENVQEAIRAVRPYAVDVASGVESSPGKKDAKKLEAFIRNAKSA